MLSPWTVLLFIHLDSFGVSCRVLRDISSGYVCLLSNIMELDGTRVVVLRVPKNTFENLNSNVSFQKK